MLCRNGKCTHCCRLGHIVSEETKEKLSKSNRGKGETHRCKNGYILVRLERKSFFSPMAKVGLWVTEHRLVMAKHLGRCLHSWEIVHHKNHIRDDNRIENLQLVQEMQHNQTTIIERKLEDLEMRNKALQDALDIIHSKEKEQDIQKAIIDYLHLRHIFVYKVSNVGIYKAKSGQWIPAQTKGLPDLGIHLNGKVTYLEIKTPNGKLSKYQQAFKEQCDRDGIDYWVISSFEELQNLVERR